MRCGGGGGGGALLKLAVLTLGNVQVVFWVITGNILLLTGLVLFLYSEIKMVCIVRSQVPRHMPLRRCRSRFCVVCKASMPLRL